MSLLRRVVQRGIAVVVLDVGIHRVAVGVRAARPLPLSRLLILGRVLKILVRVHTQTFDHLVVTLLGGAHQHGRAEPVGDILVRTPDQDELVDDIVIPVEGRVHQRRRIIVLRVALVHIDPLLQQLADPFNRPIASRFKDVRLLDGQHILQWQLPCLCIVIP